MIVPVRSFNQAGIAQLAAWLENPHDDAPKFLLEDDALTEVVNDYHIDRSKRFATSFELGEYLSKEVIIGSDTRLKTLSNHGMWAWISLVFIESLVSRQRSRMGKPLAKAHYINDPGRLGYRLVARTAWDLVSLYGVAAKLALGSLQSPWGDMAEQMTSRQEIYSHRSFWPVANALYVMSDGTVKPGATTRRKSEARFDPKNKSGLGGVRRLPFTFRQFERTYNLRQMHGDQIVSLLPSEYEKWSMSS